MATTEYRVRASCAVADDDALVETRRGTSGNQNRAAIGALVAAATRTSVHLATSPNRPGPPKPSLTRPTNLQQFVHGWLRRPSHAFDPLRDNSRRRGRFGSAFARALRKLCRRRQRLHALFGGLEDGDAFRCSPRLPTAYGHSRCSRGGGDEVRSRPVANLRLQYSTRRSNVRLRRSTRFRSRPSCDAAFRAAATLSCYARHPFRGPGIRRFAAARSASHSALFLDHLMRA